METFKPGDLAIVKTSGECGFVLEVKDTELTDTFTTFISLRIPKKGPEGIYYKVETFYAEELETNVEHMIAEYEEMQEAQRILNEKRGISETSFPGLSTTKLAQ